MAKPKHGSWNNPPSSPDAHPLPCQRLGERCRPRPRPSLRIPSPAVLSALAVIATAPPVVAGGPLPLPTPPPTFLCPFIDRDAIDPTPAPCATVPSSSTTPPPPTPTPTSQHQLVADKYVQGSDSLWRKTDAWTLYGSTWCPSSTASTSVVQSQPSSSQTTPMPTSTLTTVEFDTSVLPVGWDNGTNVTSNTESTIILALAIVLAVSICVFMLGCLIWRRRKKRTRDIERKLAHKLDADNGSQDNGREIDVRGKMRMWAKATTRWRSNIRQSARRRRKRHMVSSIASRPLSPTFSDSPQVSIVAPSAPSRRGSFVSEEPDSFTPGAVLSLNGNVTEPPGVLHDYPRSASPPTYGASFAPRFSRRPPSSAASKPGSTPSSDGSGFVQRSNQPSFTEDELIPYIPPSDGHVAIDDKAQLTRIRELASSPPIMVDAGALQPVSAPEWHEIEDDLEGLGIDLSQVPMSFHNFGLPPSFPPPPSQADVPFGHLDDLPLHYGEGGDILVSLPIPGPSRPSLPSAPPIDGPGLVPSAPSLGDEDDLFQDWDDASSYVPEVPPPADLDSTPTCAKESTASPTTSRAPIPSVRESAARDGILPRYHP